VSAITDFVVAAWPLFLAWFTALAGFVAGAWWKAGFRPR
jgi:hypothetical protein